MTQDDSPLDVEYASTHHCPLCATRPVSDKVLYGHAVCRKCYYGFANRRQLAFVIDALILIIPSILVGLAVGFLSVAIGRTWAVQMLGTAVSSAILYTLFAMKDGLGGQSPGKMATGVMVLDNTSGHPISWMQSLQRNCYHFLNLIPFLGPLAAFVITLIIAFTLGKGYRIGDTYANTRVIWKRYANQPVFRTANQPAFEVLPMASPVIA